MTEPSDIELIDATKDFISKAMKNGTYEQYTPRLLRDELEKHFKLPDGSLKSRKGIVKQGIAAMALSGAGEDESEQKGSSKKASPIASKSEQKKEKSKPETSGNDEDQPMEVDEAPKAVKKPKKLASATTKVKRADKNTDAFVSMIGLGGSAEEQQEKAALLLMGSLSERAPVKEGWEDDLSELSVLEDAPPMKRVKRKSTDGAKKTKKQKPAEKSSKAVSGSEMSGKEDAPPKKRQKRKSDEPLDKSEDQLKKLKAMVRACGVQKKWIKEFEGLSSTSQQIKRVREILTDLGMTGRMSMEKAKEIREKREFEQELADVNELNERVNGPRDSRSKHVQTQGDQGVEEDDGADGSSPGPSTTRKRPGRSTVLAFLDDQSDSD